MLAPIAVNCFWRTSSAWATRCTSTPIALIPGSLALILADYLPWNTVFLITALFMLPGIAMTLLAKEPVAVNAPKTLRAAVAEPFREFIGWQGWWGALLILAFLFFYKLGDSLCTALATPFYLNMGFNKSQIGLEVFGAGLGTAAFVAYIAHTTHPAYAATQLAIFTSPAAVPRTFVNAMAGWLVEQIGWSGFFLLCAVLLIPWMLLLLKVAPWQDTATRGQ